MPPMASSASRRTAMAAPRAKRIPSIMSATSTPDGISTDMPKLSSNDQKSLAGIPRYKQVTRPTFESKSGGITWRRKSGLTTTSLSLMMKYEWLEAAIILSSENTLALGHVGGPERTTWLFTSG